MTTIIFLACFFFFMWRGYQKGFIGSISRVVSLFIAYPAAIFFTKPFAEILRQHSSLDGLMVFMVAGFIIFLVVSVAVSLLFKFVAKLMPQNTFTETGSKIGGLGMGMIIGGVFGLLVVYMIDLLAKPSQSAASIAATMEHNAKNKTPNNSEESLQEFNARIKNTPTPPIHTTDSFIDTAAKKLVSTAASTAVNLTLSDTTSAQLTQTFARNPQVMLNHVQQMTNNNQLKQLLEKPDFQNELNHGNVHTLVDNKDFQTLMQNSDMQAILASAEETNGENFSQEEAAGKLISAWQKIATLKNDPRVLDIVNDSTFQEQLNSPNKIPLLMNPKMRELTEIMFNGESESISSVADVSNAAIHNKTHYKIEDLNQGTTHARTEELPPINNPNGTQPANTGNNEPQTEKKIYRWTDENGKVHYSDSPVKN